jgi:hypothetical protein
MKSPVPVTVKVPSFPTPVDSGAGLPWEMFPAKRKYVAASERVQVTFRFRAFQMGQARKVSGMLLGQVPGHKYGPQNPRYQVLGKDGITYVPYLYDFDLPTREVVKAAIKAPLSADSVMALLRMIAFARAELGLSGPGGAA